MATIRLGTGRNLDTGGADIVTVGDVEQRGGVYMLGQPRTGKTTLLINMILQDINHNHGLCVIDPHGDMIVDILKRLPDWRKEEVILFDPLDRTHAIGMHLFQCANPHDGAHVSRTLDYVLQVFGKLFTQSGDLSEAPNMELTLRNLTILLIFNPGSTLAEIPTILEYEDARKKLIQQANP